MKTALILFLIITSQLIPSILFSFNNAYLGVYLEDLNDFERREYNIQEGVRISMVIIDSPAYQSGMQPNDIILRINDMPISSQDEVSTIIRYAQPGDEIEVVILSRGQRYPLSVVLGDITTVDTSRIKLFDTRTKHIGVRLQNLTDQLKEYFKTDNGVLIAEVIPQSPADKSGLRAGDVITHVEEIQVDRVSILKEIIQQKETGDNVLISYVRQGSDFQTKVEIVEADDLFSYDLNDEIIFLDRKDADLPRINRWFDRILSDSTRKELEKQIRLLEEELETLKKRLFDK